ncbi:MAG: hypothetical protein JXK16_09290 [Thiotrichales bacterium]|nr:hypothetical protein [Thiotrichales bacterium]
MQVGIKKLHENEWLIHVGCAKIKLDRFSVELLNITLEHVSMLEHGQSHSTFKSYIKLGLRLGELDDRNLQKALASMDNIDVLNLLLVANSTEFTQRIMSNVGGILSKQLQADLQTTEKPNESVAKASIKTIVEKMFGLQASGEIEFIKENTKYI